MMPSRNLAALPPAAGLSPAANRDRAARWRLPTPAIVVIGALGLLATACGGGSKTAATPPASTTSTSSVATSTTTPAVIATTTTTAPSATTTTSPAIAIPSAAAIARDEAYVTTQLGNCAAFTPKQTCQGLLSAVSTPDGAGGTLYAVTVQATTGDGCTKASVWFFDGTILAPLAPGLPPPNVVNGSGYPANGIAFVAGSVTPAGSGDFSVPFAVSTPDQPGGGVSCAGVGDAGTDTYVYRWNGSAMTYVSGQLPQAPGVIGLG